MNKGTLRKFRQMAEEFPALVDPCEELLGGVVDNWTPGNP